MKKHLQRIASCALLCAVVLCTLVPAAAASTGFSDVPASHWAAEEISRAAQLGLFQGETKTRFGMGHNMTRGAFVTVLCRFFQWEMVTPETGSFTDNKDPSASYYSAVETAYAHGAITRQTDQFRPKDPITREEVAVMLVRALGYGTIAGLAQELAVPFKDVTTNAGYIAMAYELGIVGGTSSTTFSPDAPATREQAAVMLVRTYDRYTKTQPQQVGIVASAENLGDCTGYEAVAVAAKKLIGAGSARVVNTISDEEAAAIRSAAAGTKQLLYVTGSETALRDPAATATALLAAVKEDGYDGLFLDLPALQSGNKKDLTALVQALNAGLGDQLLYVMVEAPVWDGTAYKGYDYEALGAAADKLVLRVAPYEKMAGEFPTAPLEPLEEVYYALAQLRDTVAVDKLSLLLTTTGTRWSANRCVGSVSAQEIQTLLDRGAAGYYASRYACAYLVPAGKGGTEVVWYLDEQSVVERVRMAAFFSVSQVCLSDLTSMP